MHDLKKGTKGVKEFPRLLSRSEGIMVAHQIASGSFGSRVTIRGLQGDLSVNIASDVLGIEVKTRKKPPRVLERWLLGLGIVAIRADRGDWILEILSPPPDLHEPLGLCR